MLSRLSKQVISIFIRMIDCGYNTFKGGTSQYSKIVILYYHIIPKQQIGRFCKQIDLVDSILAKAQCEKTNVDAMENCVAVTFDDGFASILDYAVPELKLKDLPFAVFVPSGNLGRRPDWISTSSHPFSKERVMSPSELRELQTYTRCLIGSHTKTHSNLVKLDPKKAADEIVNSKAQLEDILGQPVTCISFPHGGYNGQHLQIAHKAGYKRAFSIEPRVHIRRTEEFLIGRIDASTSDSMLEFNLKIHGAYRWMRHFTRIKKSILA